MKDLDFRSWFLTEVGEGELQRRKGSDLLQDPAMEVAMYMLYRMAYDPVAQRDHEEDIKNHPEKANDLQKPVAWKHQDWIGSGSARRAPEWIFYGVMPNESDLNIIRNYLKQNPDKQTLVDTLLEKGEPKLSGAGGISYRDNGDHFKLTGSWGGSDLGATMAKMRAMSYIVHEAQENNKEIFTGMDKHLKDMVDKFLPKLPRYHQKGLIPRPDLDLKAAPKDVIPLLYKVISTSKHAQGGGSWQGYDPNTGAMKFQLQGTGLREKHPMGNQKFWASKVREVLQQAGVSPNLLKSGSAMAGMAGMGGNDFALNLVNSKLAQKGLPNIGQEGLNWVLQNA